MERFPKGGDCHVKRAIFVAAILVCAIGLMICPPAAHQAFGGPAPAGSGHITVVTDPGPVTLAAAPPSPLGTERAIREALPPLPPIKATREIAAENSGPRIGVRGDDGSGYAANSATFNADEIRLLRRMLDRSRATARDVAWVTVANVLPAILIVGLAFILLLVALRYIFNRWFDADIYNHTWPSVLVVCVMVICMTAVLVAAVR